MLVKIIKAVVTYTELQVTTFQFTSGVLPPIKPPFPLKKLIKLPAIIPAVHQTFIKKLTIRSGSN